MTEFKRAGGSSVPFTALSGEQARQFWIKAVGSIKTAIGSSSQTARNPTMGRQCASDDFKLGVDY